MLPGLCSRFGEKRVKATAFLAPVFINASLGAAQGGSVPAIWATIFGFAIGGAGYNLAADKHNELSARFCKVSGNDRRRAFQKIQKAQLLTYGSALGIASLGIQSICFMMSQGEDGTEQSYQAFSSEEKKQTRMVLERVP